MPLAAAYHGVTVGLGDGAAAPHSGAGRGRAGRGAACSTSVFLCPHNRLLPASRSLAWSRRVPTQWPRCSAAGMKVGRGLVCWHGRRAAGSTVCWHASRVVLCASACATHSPRHLFPVFPQSLVRGERVTLNKVDAFAGAGGECSERVLPPPWRRRFPLAAVCPRSGAPCCASLMECSAHGQVNTALP